MDLIKHQKEWIDNINNNEELINMYNGLGKSYIIYNWLLVYSNNFYIIIYPSN